jgi:6-phosphofructokinase 2
MAVLTVTLNPALDVWASTPRVEPERKLHCTESELTPGGGGINVARAIHRLGGRAVALFPVGGSSGELLCDLLVSEGVPICPVPVAGLTRESVAIKETETGRSYRFVLPGPTFEDRDLEACIDEMRRRVEPGSFVVVSGSLPRGTEPDRLALLMTAADDCAALTVVDTSGPALAVAARHGAYLIKPSLNELRIQEDALESDEAIVRAARRLLGRGPNGAVLVSLAARGALLVTADGPALMVHAPAVPTVSPVGAGDSLVAAVVLAIERGLDLREAARQGVAAGTAATMAVDHTLCHADDVARLLPFVYVSELEPARVPG